MSASYDPTLPADHEFYKNKEGIGLPEHRCLAEDRKNGHSGWTNKFGEPVEYQYAAHFKVWKRADLTLRDLDKMFPDNKRPSKPFKRRRHMGDYHRLGCI